MDIVLTSLLAGCFLLSVSLQRSYAHTSLKQLKRQARSGDELARLLHRAAAYGASLRAVLWTLVVVSGAGFFVFISRHASVPVAMLASAVIIWFCFVWLPQRQARRLSLWTAAHLAPALASVLYYLHSPLDRLHRYLRRHWPSVVRSGLYDKEDLLELLKNQAKSPGNQLEEHELELATNALLFSDKIVADYLTPRRVVKAVSVDDAIGPIMMSELHDSGLSRFPVYEGKKDHIVGTLFLRDLVSTKASSKVKSVMRPDVSYVHEDQTLHDALQAILKTRHHLLIVVNGFEEYVGVISIEDVLEQIIGAPIIDEFDQYDDLRAVATREAQKDHAAHSSSATTVTTDEEVVE